MKEWNIVDAQDLEDVVHDALQTGPQRIDLRFGREAVVVLSAAVYERLVETRTKNQPTAGVPASNLLEFLQSSPIAEAIRAGEMEEDWLERDQAAERRASTDGFT